MISAIFSLSLRPFICSGCPPSCIVCTENVTICQRLTYIPAVPQTTRALLLTDGTIPSIEKPDLANLSSLTLLKLSNNGIVDINEECFHGLSGLSALLLDQNQITSETITEFTFARLPNLERLQLGNNGIGQISRAWFSDLARLSSLNLGRNHITKLEADTFTRSSLQNLQNLDLSDNSIDYIDRHAFRGLRGLRWLDLSRNRLSEMVDSFSHLSMLSVLNLNLNHWNCTCQLQELAIFLRSFIESPDRTLINAKGLVCERTENSEVQAILQLTDTNCASQSQNATVIMKSGNYRHYVRDVILTGLFCFAGAVGLIVTVATLLYNKCHHQMEPRQKNRRAPGTESNHKRDHVFKTAPCCHFTSGYEVEALPTASSVKHPQSSQQDTVNPKSRQASNKERFHQQCLGLLNQARKQTTGMEYFACQHCRLVHTFRTTLSGGKARRSAGKSCAGTMRGVEGANRWGMKQKVLHQVEGSNQGSTEGLEVRNERSGNSYYLSKEPIGIYNLGKGYCKWAPETRDVRQGQAIAQFQSHCRYFSSSPPSNEQSQLGTVALVTEPCYEIGHRLFPPGRIRNVELLPRTDLSGNQDNHRRLLHHSNRSPIQMNKKVRSQVRGEHLIRSAKRNVNATPRSDILVFANHKKNSVNQDPFGKKEPRSCMMVRASYRDSHFIDQIKIFGTIWEGDKTRRPKSVTFDLPGITDAELRHFPETGSKIQGEGREARASVECMEKDRRFRVEEKPLFRPHTSRKRNNESRARLDMKLVSVDSKARKVIPHRASVNVLMVKFILHPTKHAKVHPDEAAGVIGPLRMKKQMMTKKTGSKETYKKGKSTRKPPVCQSTGTTGSLQQAQQPKTPKQCPSVPIQNKTFCQPHSSMGPDKRDRVRGCSGGFHTDLERTLRVLSPMSPTPVRDTENCTLPLPITIPLSISFAGPQDSAVSVGPLQTPNKPSNYEATPPDITPSLPSATDAACSNTSRTSVDEHEDKETPAEQKSSTAFNFQLKEATLSGDSEGMKVSSAPLLRQPLGMKPSDGGEAENTPTGWQEPNLALRREGDWQPAPSGQSEDKGRTAKQQWEDRGSMSIIEMAESDMDGKLDKPPRNLKPSIPATASETDHATGQGQSPQSAGAFSEEAVTGSADGPHGRTEDGAGKPADKINQHSHPTEQPPLLPASSMATGLTNLDHFDDRNISSKGQNGNVEHVNSPLASPLQGAGGSEDQDPNVVILSYKNPKEGMMTAEAGTGDCTLLPKHNLATLDIAGDEANQRRKIRLVIPERPCSGSNNAVNRKIR
ncbi:uncharacterized protein lrrc53 isoform X2 [Cetorhinus maximus]